jgi:hypothetical protein
LPSIQVGDHGHVGGIFGQHPRRIGDGDGAVARGVEIDVVDAGTEVGDQAQLRAGLRDDRAIDAVRNRGHQDVRDLHSVGQLGLRHWRVVGVEARIEQFAHARFDDVRQLARNDDDGLLNRAGHMSFTGGREPEFGMRASRVAAVRQTQKLGFGARSRRVSIFCNANVS